MEQSDSITLSREEYEEFKATLLFLEEELTRLHAQPLVYATVVKADNKFNLEAFEAGDRMLIIDKALRKEKKWYGKIVSQGVDEDGWVILELPQGTRERLNIGLNGQVPQVKLVGKDDGMNVVITFDGKLFEVHGLPGSFFRPSENVKVDMETKQIHSSVGESSAGDVAYVKSIVDESHVEIEGTNGGQRVVIYGLEQELKPSDRVMLDSSNTVILRVLEKDGKDRFNLKAECNTGWDDIAGNELAKESLIEALELPYQFPELFKFYNMSIPKGVLLHGPAGCGKTMCGKASAASMARTHNAENMQSGFLYVQGPELLSMWVGKAEMDIRGLFAKAEEHYERHGYPATMFIDEAESLLPMRGSGKSSDVENTIVPQFLSLMDGLADSHVVVILATNQPKRLDPALTREGRIDRHIYIARPNEKNAVDYFRIHMKGMPLIKGLEFEEFAACGVKEIFAPNRVLYQLTHKSERDIFRLGDAVTGAMIKGVVDQAKFIAMKRDRTSGKSPEGVKLEDVVQSVQNHYVQHAALNPTFDLEDFCDQRGYERGNVKIQKEIVTA